MVDVGKATDLMIQRRIQSLRGEVSLRQVMEEPYAEQEEEIEMWVGELDLREVEQEATVQEREEHDLSSGSLWD